LDGLREPIHRGLRAFPGEQLDPPGNVLGTARGRQRRLDLRAYHRVHDSHRALAEPSEMGPGSSENAWALQICPGRGEDRRKRLTHA
jgi:hypothetical protein